MLLLHYILFPREVPFSGRTCLTLLHLFIFINDSDRAYCQIEHGLLHHLATDFYMSIHRLFSLFLLIFCAYSCQKGSQSQETESTTPPVALPEEDTLPETLAPVAGPQQEPTADASWQSLPDSAFVTLSELDSSFVLDVKYATTENFTGKVLYDCETCLLRKVAAEALIAAQRHFQQEGYAIKIYDCYRPHSVQKMMWEMVPDPRYVADPSKGSMHNRGLAVDISLIDLSTGKELEMGSDYDFFGQVSHHAYTKLPDNVIANREYLKNTMAEFGFDPITSEWWHYSYREQFFAVSNEPLPCP